MRLGRIVRMALATFALLALAGCISIVNSYRDIQFANTREDVAEVLHLYAVSSRLRDANGDPVGEYGAERSLALSYFQYDISVPQVAHAGAISWARNEVPKPASDFFAVDRVTLSGPDEMARLALAEARNGPAPDRALIFVPGFNSNEAASIYRTAQIDRDFPSPAIKILYDWPSAGEPLLYLHDLDSINFARDGLAQLLRDLARSKVSKISILGYSAGAPLALEALRQLKLTGERRVFDKLDGVIMLSPDMDLDVFRAAIATTGQFPGKLFVFSGSDDAIQKTFAPVWGDKQRLGLIYDFNALSGIDVTFIDPGASGDNGENNHLAIVGSPTYIDIVRRLSGGDLVRFAKDAEAGKVPGSAIVEYGKVRRVILPARVGALN